MAILNKIVICDDEDAVAHLINSALGDAGYLCLRARDGRQALFLAAVEEPDLLILDRMMPELDGLSVCHRLKGDPLLSRIPILMLTALASVDDRVEGLEAGADDYLAKPFHLRELHARVRALLRGSRRERDRSPVTLLPGPGALDSAIEERLAAGRPFSLLHLDIPGYDELTIRQGRRGVEALLKELGRLLTDEVRAREAVAGGVVLTHLGGDDFVVLAPVEEAGALGEALIAATTDALAPFAGARSLQVTAVTSAGLGTLEELSRALGAARAGR